MTAPRVAVISELPDMPSKERSVENVSTAYPNAKPVPRSSMTLRIANAFTRMVINWMLLIFCLLLVLFLGLNALWIHGDFHPLFTNIQGAKSTEEATIFAQNETNTPVVLKLETGDQLYADITDPTPGQDMWLPIGFAKEGKEIYFSWAYRIRLLDGTRVILKSFSPINEPLMLLIVLFGGMLFLMALSILLIYLNGALITRKSLGVIDELTDKAANITTQNLTLRLNISEASDELYDLTLTFNQMMDRLQTAYEKQNQFVSDASHELRTPIAVVQGYARMLERWGKEDKAILTEAITAINKESTSMQDLVEKLLFIARNDKDTLVLVNEPFDLSELVNELVKDTKSLETGHEIRSMVMPDIQINGDKNRIKQALRVFVENALKFTDKAGNITMRVHLESNMAVVTVKDSGMGIPENDLSRIFDRFYRVDSARERNKGGHGLGLSIARIIILRHGGKIKVASKPGEGTRFSILLPVWNQSTVVGSATNPDNL